MGNGMKTNDPEMISQVKSSQCWRKEVARLVRKPIMGHLLGLMERKYRSPEWSDALARFPDELAIGRMSRIMCWYSMRQAAGMGNVQRDFTG